jgi:hypothetical protein
VGRNKHRRHDRQVPTESRGAEVATVAWMVSVITTLVCLGVAAVVLLAAGDRAGAERAQLFGRLLHFGAFVTAIVSLVLLGVVFKTRNAPPPPAVTWFSVGIALLAIGAAFLY